MQPFEYLPASTTQDVIQALLTDSDKTSRLIAGGTTLVDLMKLEVETPARVIDLNALPLKSITEVGDTIQIGALVTNTEMAEHPLIQSNFPAVSRALLSGASVQLRNLATLGGNLLQRTRCPYFRDTASACNKREPGTGCSALDGFNRSHAILGTSTHCIAAHPSDLCVALSALEAKVRIVGSRNERLIAFDHLYRQPLDRPDQETYLRSDELIVGIEIPKREWYRRSIYLKVRDRASYAFALTSVAVALDLEPQEGRIRNSRIAFGGVGTVPWRSREAESILAGRNYSEDLARQAARATFSKAQTRTHNEFKIELATRTLVRALNQAAALQRGDRV